MVVPGQSKENLARRINEEILGNERAAYGKQVVATLAKQLTEEYGKGWGVDQLRKCTRFAETFPERQIVEALRPQLSWTQIRIISFIDEPLKRNFYIEMCKLERWSSRQFGYFRENGH